MTKDEIRQAAEASLEFFIHLVSPGEHMGACHKDVIKWWTRPDAKSHQLLLFPRDHGKSRYIAYRIAWELTKDPLLRVLYISATSNLAEKQLGFIKGIFESEVHKRYWPEHINPVLGLRSKWTNSEIALDHPARIAANVRDSSIFTAGLTTTITGLHCDIAVLDDVVVHENAYTEEGRRKVMSQYSLLSSIEGGEAREWVVGTRYHPRDLYNDMLSMREELFDEQGDLIGEEAIYEIYERAVESRGDGTGEFLWPRNQRVDGKWFGFNIKILAKKRGQYLDKTQFRAQYYNNPTDPDSQPIKADSFIYYDKKFLRQSDGRWYYREKRLNIIASIDFAYSVRKHSDFTTIVITGVDEDGLHYVLDIDRFQTDQISVYFDHLMVLSNRWGFRKLVAETTAAQAAIVKSLKDNYFKPYGLVIQVIEVKPTRHQGSKEERMEAVLVPLYDNGLVLHYQGGNTQLLEEELVTRNPKHDDIKDALTTALEHNVRPTKSWGSTDREDQSVVQFHPRFGGRAF